MSYRSVEGTKMVPKWLYIGKQNVPYGLERELAIWGNLAWLLYHTCWLRKAAISHVRR